MIFGALGQSALGDAGDEEVYYLPLSRLHPGGTSGTQYTIIPAPNVITFDDGTVIQWDDGSPIAWDA